MSLRRPASIAELRAANEKFATEAGVAKGLAYRPKSTDVFVTPYPKCGTTWVQQIVHGLRTRGSMDFDEITAVVPWLELASDMGMDVHARQMASPRAFKSHLSYDEIPKGGRYINVYRHPHDALLSMYRFLEGWTFETGSISLTEFAEAFFLCREGSLDYWIHAASYWRHRDCDQLLLLCFEHMKDDLPGTVERIAEFIGIELDDELHRRVVEQSGIDFMKRHKRQFDDHLIRATRDGACGIPPGGDSSKVRDGDVGRAAQVLQQSVIDTLQQRWADTLGREFGLQSYADLQTALQR